MVLPELAASSVNLSARAWVNSTDFGDAFFEDQEKIKEALDTNKISMPFPQVDVHIINRKESDE